MQPNESNRRTVLKSPDLLVTGKSNLKKCDLSKDTQRMRQEGGENQRKLKNLNRQFERDILRLENSINSMDVSDKTVATEWITKLKARPPNLNEALARNYILTHLLQLTHLQIFKCKPFCRPPPQNSLSKIKSRIVSYVDLSYPIKKYY